MYMILRKIEIMYSIKISNMMCKISLTLEF
jgi:hypothetical protein